MEYEKGSMDMTQEELDEYLDDCVKDAIETDRRIKAGEIVYKLPFDENSLEDLNSGPKQKKEDSSLEYLNSQLIPKENSIRQEKTMENQTIPEEQVNMNIPAEVKIPDGKIGEKQEKPHLNGKEVTVTDVKLEASQEIAITKTKKEYRAILFKVFYDEEYYENYGGFRQYKNGDTFSPVTIWDKSQAAANMLFEKWLDKVGKKREDVSYKDFIDGLKGMKAKLIEVNVMYQGNTTHKNIIGDFL